MKLDGVELDGMGMVWHGMVRMLWFGMEGQCRVGGGVLEPIYP